MNPTNQQASAPAGTPGRNNSRRQGRNSLQFKKDPAAGASRFGLMMWCGRLSLLFLCLLLLQGAAFAQRQHLRGTVVDNVLQAPVAGATVVLQDGKEKAVTDENGQFRFELPIGSWNLSVTHLSYKEVLLENI